MLYFVIILEIFTLYILYFTTFLLLFFIYCVQVWAVLKPGFLALLEDPFHTQPLDIIVFDVLPASDGNGEGRVLLAKEIKERNPLRHAFKVSIILSYWSFIFFSGSKS